MKPVIDVHAHIFSGRDIPLKGYLLSREYEKGIIGWFKLRLIPIAARCVRRKFKIKKYFLGSLICYLVMKIVYFFLGDQYRQWADTLSKKVVYITKELIATYKKDRIELYVPLLLDYEYWFKNTPDTPIKRQIERIYKNIVLQYGGQIHPFVPFDPARELAFRHEMDNPDGCPELNGSLSLVKDAIENKGFIGVKLYNSMGYKPLNNTCVDEKRRKIALHKRKYVFKGDEYDEVLSELYDYCIENEVPITTHCGMYGVESYTDASFDFGKAIFWRDVLEKEKYKNLRLNLAHFGWNLDTGYGGEKCWIKDICKMMKEFNYLFTDVSCHKVVLDEDRGKYQDDYKKICRDFPIIKKRLLFGIDWHVIKRIENFENFRNSYEEVLKHDDLFSEEEIRNFLGGNAMNFLGLLPGGKNRQRLEKFYQRENIEPPKWFKDTDPP